MSQADFDTLMKRLAGGEALDTVLQTIRPSRETELLKRCAAVRELDAGLFEVLADLHPRVEEPGLDALLAGGALEAVPGRDDRYRVRASRRQDHYNRWWAETPGDVLPAKLRALSERVSAYCEQRPGFELEGLYHQLIVEPEEALTRFETLYEAADAAFELSRCEDLLEVVDERLALLGVEAAETANRHRRRLRSRTMWMTDWYRTARFLPPGGSEASIDALLSGENGRVLVLWSKGGMGKSTHLRWLIARRCVPGDDACARIDFDEVDPLLATRDPSTLLLEVAYQLDQQLPDAPFHELLTQYVGHRERLLGGEGTGSAGADDVIERVTAVLRDIPADRRVVLALDTLEMALLVGGPKREQSDLAPLLRHLAEIVDAAPALRLVFASRYALSERIRDFGALFPDATELLIPPLTDAESRRYLSEHRGIEDADVVQRLAESADGIPFKLELLADYAVEHPDLEPEELTTYASVDLRYVMERIVDRLEPDLQPLVRYGVAPRVLERRFVREVLGPMLGDPGLDALWPRLKRYAGTASWVMLEPGDVDALRFHQVVLDPLRELLADSSELHRRASEWFEDRARSTPANATRWLCEAVYHRFQAEGGEAGAYWAALIDQARADNRPERRRALAAEVLRDDYARGGDDLISPRTVLRARWELAVAAIQVAHEDAPERRQAEWLEADRALADLHHLLADFPDSPLSEAEMALLEAGVRLGRRDLAGATPYVKMALGRALSHEDRLWLSLVHAQVVANASLGDSIEQFRTALAIAGEGPRPASDRAVVLLRMANFEAQHDRFEDALDACEQASRSAEGRTAIELELVRAEIDLRAGSPSRALEHLGSACDEPEIDAREQIMRIRALLAAARTDEANAVAEGASARFSRTLMLGGARQQAVAAEGRELRGKVRAARLDVEGAIEDFREAADRWSGLGSTEAVCRCRVRGAELQLRGTRDINKAEVQLDQARRAPVRRGDDAWTRRTLLGAELLAQKGRVARAEALADSVLAELTAGRRAPRALIDAAQRGMALAGDPAQERYLTLLCDELAKVTPPIARLPLLQPLERCRVLTAPAALRTRLRDLVPSPGESPDEYADLSDGDRALLLLRDADVERIARHADTARRIVRAAWGMVGPAAPVTVRREVLRAAGRVGDRELVGDVAATLGDERGVAPLYEASMLLEAAEAAGPGDRRAGLLATARGQLNRLGATATGWLAVAFELDAGEAERAGDAQRAEADRRHAVERYAALGDDFRAHALASAHHRGADAPGVSAMLVEHEARVTVRLRSQEVTISVRRLSRPRSVLRVNDEPALVRTLVERSGDMVGRAAPGAIVRRLLEAPGSLGEELAGLLTSALGADAERTAGSGPPFDVGLRSRDTVIRALPWELAAPALAPAGIFLFRRAPRTRSVPVDVRALQSTLSRLGSDLVVDGILGERTRAELREFQAQHDLPATGEPDAPTAQRLQALSTGAASPRVAVVRPSRALEATAFRGARQSGVPVDWQYEMAGFDVMALEAPTAEELKFTLERRPVAILHLNLGFVDHHGTPAIDLGQLVATTGSASAGRLTGTALDALIPPHVLSPLVILDATAPQSRREAVTQLLLRNAFAGELAAVGTVRGILATGLRHYGQQKRLTDALIRVLARGGDLRELHEAAVSVDLMDAGTPPASHLPPALFARTPDLRYPSP